MKPKGKGSALRDHELVMIDSNSGEIQDVVKLAIKAEKKALRAFTMLFHTAAPLAGDDRMTISTFRVLWAVLTNLGWGDPDNDPEYRGTHQELADITGVARETVTKALKVLTEIGVVETRRGAVVVSGRYAYRGKGGEMSQVVPLPRGKMVDVAPPSAEDEPPLPLDQPRPETKAERLEKKRRRDQQLKDLEAMTPEERKAKVNQLTAEVHASYEQKDQAKAARSRPSRKARK